MKNPSPALPTRIASGFLPIAVAICALSLAGCSKEAPKAEKPPADVTVMTVERKDVPVTATFVAQTQSSQAVNIQARVSGFLDKRVYVEGSAVKAGQVLFQMDQKPFQAQLDAQKAALQRSQASLEVAKANLARTKPLAQQNALSQKDLDDAQGQYDSAAAAVEQGKAQVQEAELNLSYTTITSPVTGVSSFAAVADGTYVDAKNAQLTTVSVLTPMWINFSISENEIGRIRNEVKAGQLKLPENQSFVVEIELVDGSIFPFKGRITFTDPSFNPQTGTFLIRASVDNPNGVLRPNQYVRTRLIGGLRPQAILVPQRAVQQGARGHFVWVVDSGGKAEQRPVQVGDWYGDSWFISQGLAAGDQVVIDGGLRLAPDAAVKATPYVPKPESSPATPGTADKAGAPAPAGTPHAAAGATGEPSPPSAPAAPAAMPRTAGGTSGAASPPLASAASASAPRRVAAATGRVSSRPVPASVSMAVHFGKSSAMLDAGELAALRSGAEPWKSGSEQINVTGYADRTGDHAFNVELAKHRALAVRDALSAAGIQVARIRLVPPVDVTGSGSDMDARRVEIAPGP